MKSMEQLYTDNKDMIKFFAWRYTKKYHLEFDDLEAECNLSFCSACQSYDSSKSSFSTYLYTCLNNCMKNYCAAAARIREYEINSMDLSLFAYSLDKEDFDRLDNCQQTVLDVALDLAPENKANKTHIIIGLRSKGWSRRQVLETFHSIQQTVEARA
jgi:RNA polymerase sigma factor (sigma-70 family)